MNINWLLVLGVACVGLIILNVAAEIIENSKKKTMYKKNKDKGPILNSILSEKAAEYYEYKYGEKLSIHHILLNSFEIKFIDKFKRKKSKIYNNSGYVFLDENERKSIYVSLTNKDFKLFRIYDNLQDKDIINDMSKLLSEDLEKNNIKGVKFGVQIKSHIQTLYNGDIEEYLKNDGVEFSIIVEKKIDCSNEDLKEYYDEESKKISSVIFNHFSCKTIQLEIIFSDDALYIATKKKDLIKAFQEPFYPYTLSLSGVIEYDEAEEFEYIYYYPSEN